MAANKKPVEKSPQARPDGERRSRRADELAKFWSSIRAEYEVGSTVLGLSKRYNVSRAAIVRHRDSENWRQDSSKVIATKTEEKIARLRSTDDPEKREAALESEAERRAAVVHRHRNEWDTHAGLLDEVFRGRDFHLAKLTKITAEILAIRQKGEREAWGLVTGPSININNSNGLNINNTNDLQGLTDDELAAIITGNGGA